MNTIALSQNTLTADDRDQIRQLIALYSAALDSFDIDTFSDCFSEDAVFEPFGPPGGPLPTPRRGRGELADIVHSFRASADAGWSVRHMTYNILVEGAGDEARATCDYLAVRATSTVFPAVTNERPAHIFASGKYFDEFRRLEGDWKFTVRRIRNDPQPHPYDRWTGEALGTRTATARNADLELNANETPPPKR
ncbi:nuclear transport factor 2 family protein [Rhodococcus globerulus]|uniref:nuclear transport factor 2 family protein n=1 Tax=Rhodococcus globerulus TaxID=33008 RepID=UPI001C5878C5|nr:nuclear transport factor 2 family protein [Rhodococcus globerulus]QXW01345.1 nuclear transport factor 2 family protein [Rhodococcus globerulus]